MERRKIVAIRIMNDERIKADSAFPMELLALVAALRILDRIPGCKKSRQTSNLQ